MKNMSSLLFLAAISLHFVAALSESCDKPSAVFAFGDCYLDSGNNNQFITICRSDHKPYGLNLPGNVASGRPTDGELTADILISGLGIKKQLPAYLDPGLTDEDLLTGATFAFSCSGLDDLTARQASVPCLTKQFEYFKKAVERMQRKVGEKAAAQVLHDALFFVSGGTHDMLNNFYMLPSKKLVSLPHFLSLMLGNVERIHSMGGMRIGVMGMPPIGCIPVDVTSNSIGVKRACVSQHNSDAQDYNSQLKALTQSLQVSLSGTKIVYVDIYTPMMDIINNPKKFGMEKTIEGCCGTGLVEMGPLCNQHSNVCKNPSKYVFWDAVHPSKATNMLLAKYIKHKALPDLLS
ncbi:hypothetical protein C2S52_020233 [Perilla frutescens var. hirtella]|uniref:GDSL esterase/lipase n=1 Tax=Perilla frutescens var. hirtella TaxID=608512 RepID=A0AAD4J759_PERFH|nr:hypothetical protein C2S52_020233 [Perilla frutescens var. hirtella]KAH6828451.1 hypothetical protein C2S53_013942 [Perilla frutescens var. hirtella]